MLCLMKSQNAALQQEVIHGVALLLAQMLNPGAHQEGLDKQAGTFDILVYRPAHRPGAAAHPTQLVDHLQKGLRVLRVDDVLVRYQHRAALVRQVNLHAVQRLAAEVEVQIRIFPQLPAEHGALASTIPSVATTSEVGVPKREAICPQMALPAVIEPKNTVR